MATSDIFVDNPITLDQLRSELESGHTSDAVRTANDYLLRFVSERSTELSLEDARLLAQALNCSDTGELFAAMNGPWIERNFGVHMVVEWRKLNTIDGWKRIAVITYREV